MISRHRTHQNTGRKAARLRLVDLACVAALVLGLMGAPGPMESRAYGLAANKVWFKTLAPGRYRVYVNVTIPELKQFREYHVDFRSYRKASAFFWQAVKGADFYPPNQKKTRYSTSPKDNAYSPW